MKKVLQAKTVKDFGANLYTVLVTDRVSKDKEITVRGDGVDLENGDFVVFCYENGNQEKPIITFSIARGYWAGFYLTEEVNYQPVSVERWRGVTGFKVVENIKTGYNIRNMDKDVFKYPEPVVEKVWEPVEDGTTITLPSLEENAQTIDMVNQSIEQEVNESINGDEDKTEEDSEEE